MPLDSSQVAQMTGMYQGMAMNQMAYSNQIGMGGPPPIGGGYGGAYGDRMMGSAMNTASAIGGPAASAFGALAPMGISAGLGLGMAASTGIGIPFAAGAAGAQYAGSQMYTGAQQQQALNSSLRGNYSFQNQQGGQGFNRADMSQIGSQMRTMSGEFGPGGQIASFGELSGIAAKMGGMGLAQGVKDVQEFSKKFKETVIALKTMAKDLGTTLEGAMEFAASAKGSGIFGMTNAQRFTSAARGTAAAGGLAMSEVTSMANIGSQISRSIGGLGRQGAMAGMKTIGQIGTAQQMGVLSEEDIYNVTGQTGAEGRQAYAANSMVKAGGFLQSGKGRRLLASIAGKDGSLDEAGVAELMGGGMSIAETMKRDNTMKSSVGRANFIRNEGRLRGAALQEIGAFLPALQLKEWAESKGVDINNMDDRSMLFAQRQLGMGRDEVDQAVKMASNLPQIMQEMKQRQSKDAYMQSYAQSRQGMGVEGVKQRLNQAKETVNNKLQKLGQDFFNDGSEAIDGFINKLTGAYTQKFSEETEKAYRNMSLGSGSKSANSEMAKFGGMGPGSSSLKGLGSGPAGGLAAFNTRPGGTVAGLMGGMVGGFGGAMLSSKVLGGLSDADRFKAAGWDTGGAKSNKGLSQMLSDFGDISRAANEPASDKYLAMGGKNAAWVDDAITSGSVSGTGKSRLDAFGKTLLDKGTPEQQAAWKNASEPERARMMTALTSSRGISGEGGRMSIPDIQSAMMGSQMTESQRREAMAAAFTGRGTDQKGGLIGGALGMLAGSALGPIGGAIGSALGGWLGNKVSGDSDRARALGAFLDSKEATNLYSGLRAGGEDAMRARAKAVNDIADLKSKGNLGAEDTARLQGLQGSLAAADYDAAMAAGGGKVSKDALNAIATKYGLAPDQVVSASNAGSDIERGKVRENVRGMLMSVGGQSEKRMKALSESGVASFEGGKVTLKSAALGGQAKSVAERLLRATMQEADAGHRAANGDLQGGYDEGRSALDTRMGVGDELNNATVAQKRDIAKSLARAGLGDESSMVFGMASAEDRLKKQTRRRGADAAVAGSLGITLDDDMKKAMKGASAEEKAKIISQAGGITNASNTADIAKALQNIAAGKTGSAASLIQQVQGSTSYTDAQKEKQMKEAESKDPLMSAVRDSTKKTADFLEQLVTGGKALNVNIAQDNSKNTPDGESGTAGAPQPGKPGS
jgi:hypothetical protein